MPAQVVPVDDTALMVGLIDSRTPKTMNDSQSTSGRIMLAAGALGTVGFLGGIVVPGLLDPTTVQGPLLGFVTGPLGVIVGGHAGIVWSAHHQRRTTRTEFVWLAAFGGLILTFNEVWVVFLGFPSIVLPSAFLISAATAAALPRCTNASRVLTRLLVTVSIAMLLLFVTAIFPPVTTNRNFRGTTPRPPRFAFVLDGGFDSSHRVPPWSVDGSKLQLEWAAVILLSALVYRTLSSIPASRKSSTQELDD
jgi:hypothetical protein